MVLLNIFMQMNMVNDIRLFGWERRPSPYYSFDNTVKLINSHSYYSN